MTAQVRLAVLPELHQLRTEAEHDPLDVLPAAARSARAAQARQRPVRLGRADRFTRRSDAELRPPRLPVSGRRGWRFARASTRCSNSAKHSLEIKRKVIQRHIDGGLFPYTKRYLGTLRNHFSTHRCQWRQRDDPQLHRRRARHHHGVGPCVRVAPAGPYPRAHCRFSGGNRAHVQPGGDAGRRHDLSLRQGGPQALPGHPAGRHSRHAVLHQLVASCRSVSPTIRSRRSSGRRLCRANTPAARCCTST